MYRLMFFTFLIFFLASCTKVVEIPVPINEPDPAENPIFSTLDATPQQDEGLGLAISGSDLYVVGRSEGDLDGTNQGKSDGILRRYNGLKLWGVQFGTRNYDYAKKIATDSNGNVYVVGTTSGPLGFQVGRSDVFLAKFNKDGELLWGKQFGTKKLDEAVDLVIDNNDRIYVLSNEDYNDEGFNSFVIRKFSSVGSLLKTQPIAFKNRPSFYTKAMTIDNQNRLIVLTNWDNSDKNRGIDIRLFKYTSNLNLVWQSAYSTTSEDYTSDITVDSNNNIYFTLSKNGGHFVKKDANGNTIYTKRLEYSATGSNTHPESITTDSNNNIYIVGSTFGSFPGFTNAGRHDIVVFKYDSNGTEKWINQFDDGNYGSEDHDYAKDIAVSDVVYITGLTYGNLLTGSADSYGRGDVFFAELRKDNGSIVGVDQ